MIFLAVPGSSGPYGPLPPWKQSHNAHGSQEFVTIKYPYHPLCGQEVKILGQRTQNDESCLIVELPTTGRQHIPTWMTEDVASLAPIVSSPTLDASTLLHLSVFLKPIVLSLSGNQSMPNKGADNVSRNKPPT